MYRETKHKTKLFATIFKTRNENKVKLFPKLNQLLNNLAPLMSVFINESQTFLCGGTKCTKVHTRTKTMQLA